MPSIVLRIGDMVGDKADKNSFCSGNYILVGKRVVIKSVNTLYSMEGG